MTVTIDNSNKNIESIRIPKEFKNNFQFTMAAALNYVNKENESKLGYVKTKFGVSLSFVD